MATKNTKVSTTSYVSRVLSKLKEGPEASIEKYAKEVAKFYEEQIKLAKADNEENEIRIEEKLEEIQDAAESIDLQAIKSVDTRKSYIETKAKTLNQLFVNVDALKARIEANNKQIANYERLLSVYA